MSETDYSAEIEEICRRARKASLGTADLSTATKNAWLEHSADRLEAATGDILASAMTP